VSVFIKFLVLGLGAGSLYGLLAQGLVVIYRGSSVINFSQGAIATLGGYAFFEVRPDQPAWVSVLIGVAIAAAIGLAIQVLVMTPMLKRNSSPLARVIATLGVLAIIQQGLLIHYGTLGDFYTGFLPTTPLHFTDTIIVGTDRLWLLGIGAVLSAGLWAIYRYTRFGMATTASAENSIASSALGWSPSSIMAINWTIGGALAGLAGILIAPLTGLSPSVGALTVVPALAAALVGGFSSFPLTFLGGLLVGVLESEASWYIPKWTSAAPFLVIIVMLVLRGRALPLRGFLTDRLPRVGNGQLRPVLIGGACVLLVASMELFTKEWTTSLTTSLIVAILCLSLVVITGFAGQVSLAQYAIAGIGALISSRLADAAGVSFLPALLIGVAGSIVAGALIGLPALRVRGANLMIVTLGLGLAIQTVVLGNPDWTGGPIRGTVVPPPQIFGWELDSFRHPESFAIFCLGGFVIAGVLIANLRRGRTGRRLLAVRNNERAAASIGISVVGAKLFAFSLASGLAGFAGVLLAFRAPNVSFSQFDIFSSITLITIAVIGGIGYVSGSAVGGSIVVAGISAEILSHFFDTTDYFTLALGVLLLVQLTLLPDGAAANFSNVLGSLGRRIFKTRPLMHIGPDAGEVEEVKRQSLELRHISVTFGTVPALTDVSMTVQPGEVVGLIGPNGAGKTTLIDVASGFVRSSAGQVVLDGVDISKLSPHARARRGLVRSWQSLELFEELSVEENILVAAEKRDRWSYLLDLVRPSRSTTSARLAAVIEEFQLNDILRSPIADLPYAQRHLVSIARAVASEASVLLLDEPAAGLDDKSSQELTHLIRRLAERWQVAVLLVEHDVPLVMQTCDRVVVLDRGEILASGLPAELRSNPAVVDAYLGAETEGSETNGSRGIDSVGIASLASVRSSDPDGDELAPSDMDRTGEHSLSGRAAIRAVDASAGYGKVPILENVDLDVRPGEVVVLLGANGAGKTTLLRMLAGVLPATAGVVELNGTMTAKPLHKRARAGLAYVTEERSIFRGLTTGQNLRLGRGDVDHALELVPELRDLLSRRAGLLSGGEQQMLTLARALAAQPRVLLADELSIGLAPLVVRRLFEAVRKAADDGLGVLLVEQQARAVLPYCDRAYVLRRGRIVMDTSGDDLGSRVHEMEAHYLGDRS
jgi:sulfate-transporting ATPase